MNDCIAHEDEDKLGEHRRCDSRKNPRDGEIAAVDVSERVVIHWKSSGLERLEDSKVRWIEYRKREAITFWLPSG